METMIAYLDGMDASVVFAPATEVPVPRVLAALGPKMLDLARDRGDGAHPYLVPPAHTALARAALGPDKLLIPEQAVLLETDPVEARRIGREHLSGYLRLPNYVNNLRRLGYGDDLADGGSDRLVDAIVAWGSEGDIARRIAEHADNGADHVLLQPLGDLPTAVAQLGHLAPVVLGGSAPR
jgi:probable F420-dependent oxidoreductase